MTAGWRLHNRRNRPEAAVRQPPPAAPTAAACHQLSHGLRRERERRWLQVLVNTTERWWKTWRRRSPRWCYRLGASNEMWKKCRSPLQPALRTGAGRGCLGSGGAEPSTEGAASAGEGEAAPRREDDATATDFWFPPPNGVY